MLFPDVDLVRTRDRDRWLTKHYRRLTDDSTFKRQPASLLPGGITFVTGFQQGRGCDDKNSAPEELIVEVDQAYFRQSLRKKSTYGSRSAASMSRSPLFQRQHLWRQG